MLVEEKVKFKSNNPPAITISAARSSRASSDWANGWKVDTENMNSPGEILIQCAIVLVILTILLHALRTKLSNLLKFLKMLILELLN